MRVMRAYLLLQIFVAFLLCLAIGCTKPDYCQRVLGDLPDNVSCIHQEKVSAGVDITYFLSLEGGNQDLEAFLIRNLQLSEAKVDGEMSMFPGLKRPNWWPAEWSRSVRRFSFVDSKSEQYALVWIESGDLSVGYVEIGRW